MNNINTTKLEQTLYYFIIIDILFLPYLNFFVIPISLPFLFIWYCFNLKKIKICFDLKLTLGISFCVLISTISSFLYIPNYINDLNIWSENLKRALQLISSFIYIFYIYYFNYIKVRNIKKILLYFIGFVDIFAIIYFINLNFYYNIKLTIGIHDPFMDFYYTTTTDMFARFSYIWSDPNSIGYIIVGVGLYLLINEKSSQIEKIFIYISMIFIILCTMSTGAMIALIICMIMKFLFSIRNIKVYVKYRYRDILFFMISILIISFALINIPKLSEINIFNYSINRIESNSTDSRIDIYTNLLINKNPIKNILLGEGYNIILDNQLKRPHSDHLRILYAYGGIVYILILILLFRKYKKEKVINYLYKIPFFICFSINTLIDEQKILIIMLILITYERVKYKEREKCLKKKYQ